MILLEVGTYFGNSTLLSALLRCVTMITTSHVNILGWSRDLKAGNLSLYVWLIKTVGWAEMRHLYVSALCKINKKQ